MVDDGSTDDSVAVVTAFGKADARIRVLVRPDSEPKGANACRNYGFEQCIGVYVNWFDSDDMMLPNLLSDVLANFNQKLNFVGYSGCIVDYKLDAIGEMNCYQTDNLYGDYLKWKLKLVTMSVVFRKEFLINHCLFNTTISRGQETEFFARLFFKRSSEEYKMLTDKLFLYRQHYGSKTSKNKDYISDYKFSQAFIIKENLSKVREIQDYELSKKFYKQLLEILIETIRAKDYKICLYVISVITNSGLISRYKAREISIIGKLLFYRGKPNTYFYNRWINSTLLY